ncbi:MAG: hypothetical protein AB7O97_22115 [Planctomycetota bacterium]
MHTTRSLLALALAAAPLAAQNSLVFTGRFPFQSLDTPNERPGGSTTRLEEFDFSFCTPGVGAFARSLQPATAHQAYFGDADADGNYTKFAGFKTYFQSIQMGGLFVKNGDKALLTHDKVFWTVRANAAPLQFEVFTGNGTAVHVMRPGDFVRFTGNGNVEFFIDADQLDVAAGPPPSGFSSVKGASAMCQDALGNLYYSPPQGGHWVNGNQGGPVSCNDGAIVMIDAANITYDANGNVASIVPGSARVLIEENFDPSPGTILTTRQMVLNSLAFDRTGAPIAVSGVFGRVCGLDLDPNGGTWVPRFPDSLGNFPPVPNFVFASDAGSYGGTIWSTAGNGTVATINGVLCGSTTLGVPADGSWLGVQLDVANFQPSLMGLVVVDTIPYEPLVLDMPNFGAIQTNATQPNIEIDVHFTQFSLIIVLAEFSTPPVGSFPVSVSTSLLPLGLGPFNHAETFPVFAPFDLGALFTDPNGYASMILPNPHVGQFLGVPMLLQAGGIDLGGVITVSNPVMAQFK